LPTTIGPVNANHPARCYYGRHNSLLHCNNSHAKTSPSKQPAVFLVSSQRFRSLLLGIAYVNVRDLAGCLLAVRALIDPASKISNMSIYDV